MKKEEIKKTIAKEANSLENGNYEVSYEATKAFYGGKIPYAATEADFAKTDFEGWYEGEDGEEYVIAAAIIEKDENGEVSVIVDNGEVYPPKYGVEDFAEKFGE